MQLIFPLDTAIDKIHGSGYITGQKYSTPFTGAFRMILHHKVRWFCLLVLFSHVRAVELSALHYIDASGLPLAPYPMATPVQVEGTVTVGTGMLNKTQLEIFIQDHSAAINVYAGRIWPLNIQTGDSIRVQGKIGQYRGLTEIVDVTDIQILAQGVPVPDPLVLTCAQVTESVIQNCEPNESRLIRLNRVQVIADNHPEYTIGDGSGCCTLYLDPDVEATAPQGHFDVVGILKQYDATLPYTDGYEIVPRSSADFISLNGPQFLQRPHETEITSESVLFAWRTSTPATASIKYRMLNSTEWQAFGDSTELFNHRFRLQGLSSSFIYEGYVTAGNTDGYTQTPLFYFMPSSSASSGKIDIFFNQTVQNEKAGSATANQNVDLAAKMIEWIDQAHYSLDICFYSMTHAAVVDAMGRAKQRGVSVRFIYEEENYSSEIERLIKAYGVPAIHDHFGENSGEGYMHNKFLIIDHRDKSNALDDILLTGSANATYSGATRNAENLVFIQDETVCAAYTIEFNEMWGSDHETPNAEFSRFGSRKKNNTPHRFNVGGVWIEQYMSPTDATESAIVDVIDQAQQSLCFCIYSYTSSTIAKAMQARYYTVRGFRLAGVFDAESSLDFNNQYSSIKGTGYSPWSPTGDVWIDILPQLLHHKYLIADAGANTATVVTGSHNWSYSANQKNDENTLIFHDPGIAGLYLQEFTARYRESGGQGEMPTLVQSSIPNIWQLQGNYPNPFNQSTTILFSHSNAENNCETLIIYDRLGRIVRSLTLPRQDERITWDGSDSRNRPVPSGVYLGRLKNHQQTIKMVLIR